MKLRNFTTLLLLSIFLMGCASASRSFRNGRYDEAISRSISVLNRTPSNEKHLDILRDAYRIANANDKEQILALRQTGAPDIWGRIVTIYERMITRNNKIDALSSSVKNEIGFVYESHSEELAVAKLRATEFHYAAGIQLLNTGTKREARQAFAHFERVVQYSGLHFRDVENLKAHAEELGTTFVLFQFINRSGTFLPHEAVWNLTNVRPQSMNRRWVIYDVEPRRAHYQFEVVFTLDRRFWQPPTSNTRRFTETRTITDGTERRRDTSGNIVEVPRTVTIRCVVTETTTTRRARLDGTLTYFDVENQRVIRTVFLNHTAVAQFSRFSTSGDLRALSDRTRNRIMAPVIVPSDDMLLIEASRGLGEQIRSALVDNARLIR
ncbi:MAG: hypothetical protein FWE63_03475 [Bacteroidales bacterium]|nr:hypothetical protein [Bacteroidales bacterium]